MRQFISIILITLTSITLSFGQKITYDGKITDMDSEKNLSGVTVRVLSGGTEVSSATTTSNGSYSVQFPTGKVYTIEYIKPGYVTKVVKVDVIQVNEEDMPPGGKIFPPINLDIFTDREGADFSFLKTEPVVDWYFDRDRMNFDPGQVNRTKKKIADRLKEAEALAGLNDAKYNALIQEADKLYKDKTYEQALDKYVAALQIPGKEAEKHPNNRLIEIEALLQKKAEDELAYKQENQAYLNIIAAADNFAKDKEYEKAIAKYAEASEIKADEQYPKDKIIELKEELANASKREEYDKLIKQADGFFKQNSLQAARDRYQTASQLLPKEQYPKDQLAEIIRKLDIQSAEREKREKYNKAIADADALFDKEDYAASILKYKEAIEFESAATYPVERITIAENKLQEQKLANENLEAFNQLVTEGDQEVSAKNFQAAIDKYNEALTIIEDDAVKTKRDKAQVSLDDLKAEEAQANQIAALMSSAESKMSNENYSEALGDYKTVLALNTQHPEAIKGKAKAESLLAEKNDKAAKENQFNQLVTQADNAFSNEKWEEAKTSYIAAKAIFNDRPHVNNRLDEIRTKLENINEQERIAAEIQVLLDQATNLKTSNKWSDVILKYEEAIKLDDKRNDLKELLIDAQNKKLEWDAQQSNEERFAKLKQEGNVLMAQKKWADAKVKFEEALEIQTDAEISASLITIAEKEAEAALSQENEIAYKAEMKKAEDFAKAEDYDEALAAFKEALTYKENDVVATNRIADIQLKITNLEQLAEKNERYNAAMEAGSAALEDKDYAAAIKFYDDALIEKPLDSEATKLKNNAKQLIKGLQSEEEKYMGLLNSGQAKYDIALSNNNNIPDLKAAKALYEEAQKMRPNASLPQNKIVEIDELLRQIEEAKEKEEGLSELNRRYEEQLDLALIAAQNFKYENAIDYLKEASKIKPDEELPKKKIKEYQALLDQISMQNEKEKRYTNLIDKADLAFDNKKYNESIELYNEALGIKENEAYPKDQIGKALKGIEDLAKSTVNKEYQNHIDKADAYFANKEFKNALSSYQSALTAQPNDSYAQDKIDETRQVLEDLKSKAKRDADELARFNERIAEADALFNSENYLEALKEYENALKINPNDVYANDRVQLSIANSKKKTDAGDNARYQKILTKADEYFDLENYDKAISLYERASKLRSTDQYPIDKLAEIAAIKNGTAKIESNVEYLGEQSNISIMEGAALLEEGAKQREQLKQQAVEAQLRKNEGLDKDRSANDYSERVAYEDEIISIKDRSLSTYNDEQEKHRAFIDRVDNEIFDMEIKSIQNDNFERGEVIRTNQNLVYINDGMDEMRQRFTHDHTLTIEQIKKVKEARDNQNIAESAHHQVKVTSTSEEILKVVKKNEEFILMSEEARKDNEVKIDEIIKGREVRSFEEDNSEYRQVMQLQDDALLAEIKVSESQAEKFAINEQLQEDIIALDAALQRKMAKENVNAYQDQLLIDSQLTASSDQYSESQEGKDDARMLALEQLKELDQKSLNQSIIRSDKQYAETQSTIKVVETVHNLQTEQDIQQKQDLAAINESVKSQEVAFDRSANARNQEEQNQRHKTVNELERIKKQEELSQEGKDAKIKENYDNVKGLKASIDSKGQLHDEAYRKEKFKTQELVDQLENSKLTFNEAIANSLADEYPEGVTQENYIRKDKDGIPVRIVTRRFVIENGRGDVYIRIQSRNGLTYSKNGMPVTEQSWINGTENAKLEKHY